MLRPIRARYSMFPLLRTHHDRGPTQSPCEDRVEALLYHLKARPREPDQSVSESAAREVGREEVEDVLYRGGA